MLGRVARLARVGGVPRAVSRVGARRDATSAAVNLGEILRDEWDGEQANVVASAELEAMLASLAARGATVADAPGSGRVEIDLGNG